MGDRDHGILTFHPIFGNEVEGVKLSYVKAGSFLTLWLTVGAKGWEWGRMELRAHVFANDDEAIEAAIATGEIKRQEHPQP